jgi:hypothetical protein
MVIPIKNKTNLKLKIEKIQSEISDISNNISELEYYSRVGDVLIPYYNILDNNEHPTQPIPINKIKSTEKGIRKKNKNKNINSDILSFFHTTPSPSNCSSVKSDSPIDVEEKSPLSTSLPENRVALFDQYMKIIHNNTSRRNKELTKFCDKCKQERILLQTDGIYVCSKCGEVENALIESDIPNYKDSVTEKPSYPYRKINHVIEWLNQFQAKESTNIPDDIYNKILAEVKRTRICENGNLSIIDMKTILKKLKLQKYYEHASHIISKITKKPPPVLSREMEESIKQMFIEIQEPFAKYCPAERTNFLNYAYVLYKFVEILHLDEFKSYFPLLKSREKLLSHDYIWKKICNDLGWDFYPSL